MERDTPDFLASVFILVQGPSFKKARRMASSVLRKRLFDNRFSVMLTLPDIKTL